MNQRRKSGSLNELREISSEISEEIEALLKNSLVDFLEKPESLDLILGEEGQRELDKLTRRVNERGGIVKFKLLADTEVIITLEVPH